MAKMYETRGVKYLPKEINPPNVPQMHPIENFWVILKQRVFSEGFEAQSIPDLIKKIKKTQKYALGVLPKLN